MKKRIRSLLVILVTLVLIALVLRKVGVEELLDTLRQAHPGYLVLSILTTPLLTAASVAKWHALLKAEKFEVSFFYLFKLYLVGYFFNNFLPSNVGGDAIRGYELGSHMQDPARAMASVFMERFTGVVVLLVFACFSFITNLTLLEDTTLTLGMAMAVVGLLGLLWAVLDARPVNFLERRLKHPFLQKYFAKFKKFYKALHAYREHRRALLTAMLYSLAFYVLAILNVYFSALTFHQPVPLFGVATVVPIIMVVAMLPLTFNGYGIQEWAYVLLFPWIGLPASVGLSAILLIRTKTLVNAMLGGLFYPGIRLHNETAQPTKRFSS